MPLCCRKTSGWGISWSCDCVGLSRSAWYQEQDHRQEQDAEIIDALNDLVEAHPRWGFWKCFARLRGKGHFWNHKRVYRVYRALGLNQSRRTRRWLPARTREPLVVPQYPDEAWSADFMSDTLCHGSRFRTFNLIDDFNREALYIEIDTSLRAPRVVRTLEQLKAQGCCPETIRVDNGPEFVSDDFRRW